MECPMNSQHTYACKSICKSVSPIRRTTSFCLLTGTQLVLAIHSSAALRTAAVCVWTGIFQVSIEPLLLLGSSKCTHIKGVFGRHMNIIIMQNDQYKIPWALLMELQGRKKLYHNQTKIQNTWQQHHKQHFSIMLIELG